MDPATLFGLLSMSLGAEALSGIGSTATSILHGNYVQRKQYKYNLALQKQAQAWQERMSNTAHQREVRDLRAAGLNPILSATGGSGASFSNASGSSVSAPTAKVADLGIADGLSSVASLLNAESTAKQTNIADKQADTAAKAQTSQAAVNAQEVATKKSQSEMYKAQAKMFNAQAKELGNSPVTRLPGQALNTIQDFLSGPMFQNGAAKLFNFMDKFNKFSDRFTRENGTWHNRTNIQNNHYYGNSDKRPSFNGFER